MSALLAPGVTAGSLTDHVSALALRRHAPRWWWMAFIPSLCLLGLGVLAVGWLFLAGVGIWGIDWPVAWGFAIINYVWWIGIASGGTFISAFFFLMRVDWRTALNRTAESMMLCAAASAAVFPILHLGRPWLFYWLFPYPATMRLWPQFRSPLLWDFFAILTYVVSSLLFWYLGLIPDLASVRDRARRRWQQVFYGCLALGFRGSVREWRHYRASYGVLAAIMAPLVVSVHSIVGLDFAGGQTPGWHSTQFPPFFVFGAALSGLAMVVLIVVPLRALMDLRRYITPYHLDVLGKLLLTSALLVGYAYLMDAFSTFYGAESADMTMFMDRVAGVYAPVYYSTLVLNVLAPLVLAARRLRRQPAVLSLVAAGTIVGMWLERYEIVVTSLHKTHLPSSWGGFTATFWDWATLAGSVGLFMTLLLLILRFLPVISVSEMRGLLERRR
ncbi:NrfD/PsrC family molybdoenzyme membrane anchor subunit [Rhodopila sp.]|jgi:molybdopterin-containing oxidoreductase family membrane subunit|uniref:NrfD/PsrC family molybdoenzyme membrane anchor subunit n=1 Tax=Rhodopila sp. TaxID=2480087 RepID=UPI002C0C4033|nr:NrfD/PsrC family molybdoenzyme membrane anchor subunit [Rhodopila sp.]HVZ10292.1 NrfD/PsrC family molybdoenzyme membrane anchor subunit [Rhodopila sp.]